MRWPVPARSFVGRRRPPPLYWLRSLERQIDYNIGDFLPPAVRWIRDWYEAIDSGHARACVTTHGELVADEDELFRRVLKFYEIDPASLPPRPRLKQEGHARTHIRTGRRDEFLEAFTPAQLERCNEIIRRELGDRMGEELVAA